MCEHERANPSKLDLPCILRCTRSITSWDTFSALSLSLFATNQTTSAAKLALATVTNPKDGKPTGRGCLLAAADIYRPAAIKQLQTLGSQIGVEVRQSGRHPIQPFSQACQKDSALFPTGTMWKV